MTCGDCIKSNDFPKKWLMGSPIPDVCQWCRHSGTCFNSTEHNKPLLDAGDTQKGTTAETCSIRCIVKSEDMCPPLNLNCGDNPGCSTCTNRSYCDYCQESGTCFNPCGDNFTPPLAVPTAPPKAFAPQSEPFISDAPLTVEKPLMESPVEARTTAWNLWAPPQCESCVWSTPGQCKTAEFCASLKGCSACTAQPACGWCGNNAGGKCIVADTNRRPCGNMQCKYWSYGSCEVACNSHSNCKTCVSDKEARCGWCAGGVLNGRKTSFCGTSTVAHQCQVDFTLECPGCDSIKNCTKCLQLEHCGYCAKANPTFSVCVEGNKQGPYDPSDCLVSPSPEIGWITSCAPWNHTVPPPKPEPAQPPPIHAPVHTPQAIVVPVEPPQTTPIQTPISPPVTPPVTPPIAPPVKPPVHRPPTPVPAHAPTQPPTQPPTHPTPKSPVFDPGTPAKLLEPYIKEIHKTYTIGIIIGASIAGAVVIGGGLLWIKLHASATHRHRAIG